MQPMLLKVKPVNSVKLLFLCLDASIRMGQLHSCQVPTHMLFLQMKFLATGVN
jgi:hypothetical protein